jgi:hypothetical protein
VTFLETKKRVCRSGDLDSNEDIIFLNNSYY